MADQGRNRVALITGGNRGIGRSGCLKLAEGGVDVVLTYRSHADEAAAVVEQIQSLGRRAAALQLDVGDVDALPAFGKAFDHTLQTEFGRGTFDYLVNNGAYGGFTVFGETTEDQFDSLVNVHFKGVFFLTQTLVPRMTTDGRIVNVSSGLTRFTGPGMAIYAAAKAATEMLTKYLAKDLGSRGISVNTLAPGPTATEYGGGGGGMVDPVLQQTFIQQSALKRMGQPDDVGNVLAALLDEGTGWITGERIEASGGQLL